MLKKNINLDCLELFYTQATVKLSLFVSWRNAFCFLDLTLSSKRVDFAGFFLDGLNFFYIPGLAYASLKGGGLIRGWI